MRLSVFRVVAFGAAILVWGSAESALAQVDLNFMSPVGNCDTRDQRVTWEGNYLVSTGNEVTFQCGLDTVLAPVTSITQATVYVDVAHAERGDHAWARLCYRSVSAGASPICGAQAFPGLNPEVIVAYPPPRLPRGPRVVYLEVFIPSPSPGYHYFNGFRIQS